MNKLRKILKGMLLWVTAFAVAIFLSGAESIYDSGYFIHSILVCASLCYLCYKCISKEELAILSGSKWFNKIVGSNNGF